MSIALLVPLNRGKFALCPYGKTNIVKMCKSHFLMEEKMTFRADKDKVEFNSRCIVDKINMSIVKEI